MEIQRLGVRGRFIRSCKGKNLLGFFPLKNDDIINYVIMKLPIIGVFWYFSGPTIKKITAMINHLYIYVYTKIINNCSNDDDIDFFSFPKKQN